MRLPVEHYYELDPGLIKPLGGSAFALQVPRVSVSLPLPLLHAICWNC
jgi:hypothetical protein